MVDTNSYIKMPDNSNSNFRYREFIKSETAIRLNIPNEPSTIQWKNIEALVINVLQPIRAKFGPIKITSGYRSAKLCQAIGSSTTSNHTRGEAADIESFCGVPLIDIFSYIYSNLECRELIAEYFPDGWIHVAYRKDGNVKNVKLKDKQHNYAKVDLNYITNLYGNMVA